MDLLARRCQDCIWNECSQLIDWHAVPSKGTLISALKQAIRLNSHDVVFEICCFWTHRMYRLYQNNGNFIK